jgi:hypothetical protein
MQKRFEKSKISKQNYFTGQKRAWSFAMIGTFPNWADF